ncbi:hypothetical protein MTBBW1_540017 [Desulfamplus magnetovallimortis]|uniref:EamA domain-containing protein n=1 Tax=Desulfamplus magnetovallimortis TaxID=1246637 RepID=A0A1W1HI37_9BACT|nr:hypothetical protein MTBBW1_540017 [Desulfamplus magnetovallimortis]
MDALEPVYGILFALILLGEIHSIRIIGGGVIILKIDNYNILSLVNTV